MSFNGSCHCGAIHFTVDQDVPAEAITCNCSICRRRGSVLTFVPADQVTITGNRAGLISYTFNKKVIDHLFCGTCGCAPFAEGNAPDGSSVIAVNLRCADVDLNAIKTSEYDGAAI